MSQPQPSDPALFARTQRAIITYEQETFMPVNKVLVRRIGPETGDTYLVRAAHKSLTRNQLLYCVYGFLEEEALNAERH
jgi:hypothetical protein